MTDTITLSSIRSQATPGGRRNLIINGAMQVAQRGTSASGVTSAQYLLDRWSYTSVAEETVTLEQSTDAPDGFATSNKVTITTADGSLDATDYALLDQRFEGQNLQGVAKGTSSAKQLTLSFWVKGSITGTYIVELYDNDNTRQVSLSYTINSENSWEYKTLTFPADSTGAFDNDNNLSLYLQFILAAGSNFTSGTLNTSWASSVNANRFVGQTNLVGTLNATFQITGVQLEVGSVATPFEHLSYGEQLALCQRYFHSMGGESTYEHFALASQTGSTDGRGMIFLPQSMRTTPSIGQSGSFMIASGGNTTTGTFSSGTSMYFAHGTFRGKQNLGFDFYPGSAGSFTGTNGDCYIVRANNSTDTRVTFDAEL